MTEHDHMTRDIKPKGECPGCDLYHSRQEAVERAARAAFLAGKAAGVRPTFWDDPQCNREHWRKIVRAVIKELS